MRAVKRSCFLCKRPRTFSKMLMAGRFTMTTSKQWKPICPLASAVHKRLPNALRGWHGNPDMYRSMSSNVSWSLKVISLCNRPRSNPVIEQTSLYSDCYFPALLAPECGLASIMYSKSFQGYQFTSHSRTISADSEWVLKPQWLVLPIFKLSKPVLNVVKLVFSGLCRWFATFSQNHSSLSLLFFSVVSLSLFFYWNGPGHSCRHE